MRAKRILLVAAAAAFSMVSCSSEPQKKGLEFACIESGGQFLDGVCQCGGARCGWGLVCSDNGAKCATDNWSASEAFRLGCAQSGGTLDANGLCRCGDDVCRQGVVCVAANDGAKCATEVWSGADVFRLHCEKSGGTLDANGLCRCGKDSCHEGIVCMHSDNGMKCATDNWSVGDAFQLQCEKSGGTLDANKPDVCRCNDQPCLKMSVCTSNGDVPRCMMDAACHGTDTQCVNDGNGIGVLYKCEQNEWTHSQNCDGGYSCRDNGCGECKEGEIRCCTDDDDTEACHRDSDIQFKTCTNGTWVVSYCPGDRVCDASQNRCPYTDACDDNAEAICHNNAEKIGFVQLCRHGGRTEPKTCMADHAPASCRSNTECGECFDGSQRREDGLAVNGDNEYGLEYRRPVILQCETGKYTLIAECNTSCETVKIDNAYVDRVTSCNNISEYFDEFYCQNHCIKTLDYYYADCKCTPGTCRYWLDGEGNATYSVCRDTSWLRSRGDLFMSCREDAQFLYLHIVPDAKGVGEIRIPKNKTNMKASAFSEDGVADEVKIASEISCAIFDDISSPEVHEFVFSGVQTEQTKAFCVDAIVSPSRYMPGVKTPNPYFVHYGNDGKLIFSNRIWNDSQNAVETVSCNSNHSGVHGWTSDSQYAEAPVYDMKAENISYDNNRDPFQLRHVLAIFDEASTPNYREFRFRSKCMLEYIHNTTLFDYIHCNFYLDKDSGNCTGDDLSNLPEECEINHLSVCLDFYWDDYTNSSYAFAVNNDGKEPKERGAYGSKCLKGCNATWTGCAE